MMFRNSLLRSSFKLSHDLVHRSPLIQSQFQLLSVPFSTSQKTSATSGEKKSQDTKEGKKTPHVMHSQKRLPPGEKISFRRDPRLPRPDDPPIPMPDDIEEFLKNIDTTLTPQQQEKVARLKRQILPSNGKRSIALNVPTKEELANMEFPGGFAPLIPPNAEALIDYALSFIPEKGGPRRSREKKRLQHRADQRIADHKRRIEQTRAARLVKLAKKAKKVAQMNEFKIQAGLPPHQPRPKKNSKKIAVGSQSK